MNTQPNGEQVPTRLTPEVVADLRHNNEEAKRKGWRAEIGVDDVDLLLDAAEEVLRG
ncbi:hypothetical protein QWY28_17285 [Nocardioides sp. SOB77]|uniref:CopG family transcriptional regulator n=1 Tax=Nocardioides oceani TaxID=3058369 RepID=A0ABT8FJ72_9ACTN|nr:hypothetical protein [Nocardioides oceani]MDN4174718.1 hypothetical protein [Nocardioides oceani]